MELKMFEMTREDLEGHANATFQGIVRDLAFFGEISAEHANYLMESYVVILVQKGAFGNLWDKCMAAVGIQPEKGVTRSFYKLVKLATNKEEVKKEETPK